MVTPMFRKILIANRGEIACRIIRTCRALGIATVAVYSDADERALHRTLADEAVCIGPAPARDSYLRADRLIEAARATGAEAVHPGYGFLSENADFAEACAEASLVFIGAPAAAIRAMGLKGPAKKLAAQAGVPVVPGYEGADQSADRLLHEAQAIGFPVLIKAIAGGGGKGMRRVNDTASFERALSGAKREALSAFGDDRVLIEKCITQARHIEIQIFADTHGNAVHLFERDCSVQRRHQKILEEAPAHGLPEDMRAAMGEAALKLARAIDYAGAGTMEFIVDASEGLRADRFYFMEMNTRLQVEHPVTEAITGFDLVAWQIQVAAGGALPCAQSDIVLQGCAVEARICAENPARNFLPSPGVISEYALPAETDGVRIDTGVRAGDEVTPWYDPLLAKVIVHAPTRAQALEKMAVTLDACTIAGIVTNTSLLAALVRSAEFVADGADTGFLERQSRALIAAAA